MNSVFTIPKIKNELYFGIFILILKVYGQASSILPFYNDTLDTVLSVIGVSCLMIHCFKKRHYKKVEIYIYLFFALLALFSAIQVKNYNIFITVVTCLAIRGENTNDIINFIFKYSSFLFIVHFIYALIRIPFTGDTYLKIINGVNRYDMGFGHPNRFSILLFNLLLMWIWVHFSTINYKEISFIFLISLINYFITMTRTNEIALVFLLILLIIYKKYPKKMSIYLKQVSMIIVPFFALCSIIFVILYQKGNSIAVMFDKILSGRIRLGSYAYEHFGFSLFGNNLSNFKIQYDSVYKLNYFTFDNIYTDILMQQGVIWFVIISILFFLLAKKKNDAINFAIIAWGIYGVTEVHGLNVYMLFTILLVNELFRKNDKVKEKDYHKGELIE